MIRVWSKIVKTLRLTPLLFFGRFFKANSLENYTSNEAQTKLKTLNSPGRIYMVISPGEYNKLFARENIYGYSPGRIYMVIRPGEYILLFAWANILDSGYSPG